MAVEHYTSSSTKHLLQNGQVLAVLPRGSRELSVRPNRRNNRDFGDFTFAVSESGGNANVLKLNLRFAKWEHAVKRFLNL